MEFEESAESAENCNLVSSSIKQLKNYPSTYSDTFSLILSVKNHPNLIFCQFCVFVYHPVPENENGKRNVSESFNYCTSDGEWLQCTAL